MFRRHKKFWLFLAILLLIIAVILFFALRRPAGTVSGSEIRWGVAYSKYFSEKMGLDWKEVYLAVLDDLKPKTIRLPIYWSDIEPQAGVYKFDDYDWMIREAEKRDIKLILIIGRKLPRWPECHVPSWASSLNAESQQTKLLKTLPEIVNRYKNSESLYLWQVENEPFLPFGECPLFSSKFLDREIETVRSLDGEHKILLTDSGEISIWLMAAARGDVFGTTMYRVVWKKWIGYYKYPLPPQFFWLKANLIRLFLIKKPIIVSELQGETWGEHMPYETTVEEQFKSMDINQFKENIEYAKQVGFPEVYLWGAEWWYWLKIKHNNAEFWEEAKSLITD